jgi:hypothetical protein
MVAMPVLGDEGAPASAETIGFRLAAAAITFSLWGVYFTDEHHSVDSDLRRALPWDYGHFVIFAVGAAVRGGFAVYHEVVTGKAAIGIEAVNPAIAVPVALYLLALWFICDWHYALGWRAIMLPGAAVLSIALAFVLPNALFAIAALMVATAILRSSPRRHAPCDVKEAHSDHAGSTTCVFEASIGPSAGILRANQSSSFSG